MFGRSVKFNDVICTDFMNIYFENIFCESWTPEDNETSNCSVQGFSTYISFLGQSCFLK